ncbi:MAG TPA: acetate kinase [Campylobacterales bacterium]|nr:acetate kinase [Campylobacterales bacterium]
MIILVLNSGSSSIKYKLFNQDLKLIAKGNIERIGEKNSPYPNHTVALKRVEDRLVEDNIIKDFSQLTTIAHRVVHGGLIFTESTIITEQVIKQIRDMIPLAPLHNPANLEGIIAMQSIAPQTKQIAFFDTAFHQTMPKLSYSYAIPTELNIRRYGFHGISHQYLLKESAKLLDKPISDCNIITLHLGNGASATAIKNGKSFKTSMGFTPLEGLVMGTRSGDIDAGIIFYLAQQKNMSIKEINSLLNRQSGLQGLCGTNDMRDIIKQIKAGETKSKFAFELFCNRIKEYIGAYIALIGKIDAIVFSGGVGANSFEVRAEICQDMEHLGLTIDLYKNRGNSIEISQDNSTIKLFALETNEELEMAREAKKINKS